MTIIGKGLFSGNAQVPSARTRKPTIWLRHLWHGMKKGLTADMQVSRPHHEGKNNNKLFMQRLGRQRDRQMGEQSIQQIGVTEINREAEEVMGRRGAEKVKKKKEKEKQVCSTFLCCERNLVVRAKHCSVWHSISPCDQTSGVWLITQSLCSSSDSLKAWLCDCYWEKETAWGRGESYSRCSLSARRKLAMWSN